MILPEVHWPTYCVITVILRWDKLSGAYNIKVVEAFIKDCNGYVNGHEWLTMEHM